MKHSPTISLLSLLLATLALPAVAADNLAVFDGGIGVHPVAGIALVGGVATPVRNDVHLVPPGGRPWVIASFRATVKADGRIAAKGTGLILAATDAIGTRGGTATVAAALFCGDNTAFVSAAVPLAVNGDFEIRGVLSPAPPSPCGSPTAPPVLLVGPPQTGTAPPALRAWFAAGIPKDLEPDADQD